MGSKSRPQKKKLPATHFETHDRALQLHRFAAEEQLETTSLPEEQETIDWQTQLDRAQRFGHNLNQVPVHANPPVQQQVSISQGKLYLQRSIVDDEQKEDEEASRMQRKKE
jgi:hypothetical protein